MTVPSEFPGTNDMAVVYNGHLKMVMELNSVGEKLLFTSNALQYCITTS